MGVNMSEPVQQWEYKVIEASQELNKLNEFGEQGWEVTGVTAAGGPVPSKVILKKPKKNTKNDYGYSR